MTKRGTNVYRVNVRGAGRVARDFDRAARAVQDSVVAELRRFGREARTVFVEAAPTDTGELAERITAVPFFGRAIRPRVSIRIRPDVEGHQGAESDGFDYLDVTRYGHRKRTIHPTTARALKVHIEGHRNPHIVVIRRSVSGVPTAENSRWRGDWVVPAAERADRLAAVAERRLGRRLESRLLR